MPVFSYIAYPAQGAKKQLQAALEALDYCEVTPAENEDVLILVTDTPNDEKEKALKQALAQISILQSLGMTFGHVDE